MISRLTPEQEAALVAALRPLFALYSSLPRDKEIGYQGPVQAVTLYPILLGQKPDGDAVVADPAALLDGTPSLCWREWARVEADDVLAQASAGPQRGGVRLADIFLMLAGRAPGKPGSILLDIFRKAGGSK